TLVIALLYHLPDLNGVGGEKRPGIVHRLDKYTSGLIVVAKHDRALWHLQDQFKARTVKKEYLALVHGQVQPLEAIIDAPIGRDVRQRKKMAVVTAKNAQSRPSQTHYITRTAYDDYTLLACHPITGRTHQIRVHLAYIGYPIVSDHVYGRRKDPIKLGRQFLHAAMITFRRPSDNEPLTISAELPGELTAVLFQLAG
ncbi:MAG: RluA family pseudouridine synthase, partial [Anaerolineae bacterium]